MRDRLKTAEIQKLDTFGSAIITDTELNNLNKSIGWIETKEKGGNQEKW